MAEISSEKLKVFISYSRRDSADFADELVAGLEYGGFAPFLDRHDIAAGEDWQARLGGLIAESDTVVFVVSPEAVKSERCVWEVERTLALSKRLLPVIHKTVPDADIPEKLRRLQFVRFDAGPGLARPLRRLADALRQDLDWIREHTRLGELASRWEARNRPEWLLLRGEDLEAAKQWAGKGQVEGPAITVHQYAFLKASEESERARIARMRSTRVLVGGLIVLAVIVLAYAAWLNQAYLRARLVLLTDLLWPRVLREEDERGLKPGDIFKECANCPEMVVVPPGAFLIGSPADEVGRFDDESPQHRITIARAFAVSRFETTFEEWDVCVADRACSHPTDEGWGRGRRPVINVSWRDAQQYVAWLSRRTGKHYRLLSEAEWEYAARAGSDKAYWWGDQLNLGNANCDGCASPWDNKKTAPVGSFSGNAFGLFDMHGNVWEWVHDCFFDDHKDASLDGSARLKPECNRNGLRGGSWLYGPRFMRSANRGSDSSGTRSYNYGLRVARTLAQ